MSIEQGGIYNGNGEVGRRLSDVTPVQIDITRDTIPHLTQLNANIYGDVSPAHNWAIKNVESRDWLTTHWRMDNILSRRRAGQSLAAGVPGFVEFGNFKALVFHPHVDSMRTVNVSKGRDHMQVASVVTTREHIEGLFDWSKLQGGLTKEGVMNMIHSFYDRSEANPHASFAGPFGFRGPAADHIPDHLVSTDKETGLRTVQLIAPGYDCPSNGVYTEAIKAMKERDESQPTYLGITSANPSSHLTGKDEPAHHLRRGIQEEFHNYKPGFFIMGHENQEAEANIIKQYPNHEPNSTTILDFSRAVTGETAPIAIHMARHGSLSDAHTEHVVNSLGMDLIIDKAARSKLSLREYSEEFLQRPDISNVPSTPITGRNHHVWELFRR